MCVRTVRSEWNRELGELMIKRTIIIREYKWWWSWTWNVRPSLTNETRPHQTFLTLFFLSLLFLYWLDKFGGDESVRATYCSCPARHTLFLSLIFSFLFFKKKSCWLHPLLRNLIDMLAYIKQRFLATWLEHNLSFFFLWLDY